MVVSVGDQINNLELRGIASQPENSNLFQVEKFSDLQTIVSRLSNAICDGE